MTVFQENLRTPFRNKVTAAACALLAAMPLLLTTPVDAKDKVKTSSDQMALAIAIKCEAKPTKRGMAAVGAVIINRVKNGNYGKSIREVVYAPNQFAPGCGKRMHPKYMEAARHMYQDYRNGTNTYAPAIFKELKGCRYFHAASWRKGGGRNYDGNIVRC